MKAGKLTADFYVFFTRAPIRYLIGDL